MPATPIPHNELERLKALREYEILDSLPELQYDDLTRLAATICECPVSIVTFVDKDRQWFKSTFGIKATQTPREGGFCAHAILESDLFVVPDASEDLRFSVHPLVTGAPHIRFYAAAPVAVGDDLNVGVICVIDTKPRILTPAQTDCLQAFSRMVSAYLEARKKCRELADALALRRAGEKALIHSSQMTALAQMAGGMAHEINNPLSIMIAHASRIKEELSANGANAKNLAALDKIENAGFRISKIIKALRLFSRDAKDDSPAKESLGSIIEDTLELCRERFTQNQIELRIHGSAHELKLDCRGVQISQVLLNLLNNAFDAVSTAPAKWVEIDLKAVGETLELSVTDSGPGIPDDAKSRIFHPFFSTKEVGKGTGLGLSISKAIIEDHLGSLCLDETSAHTRFVVTLPLGDRSTEKQDQAS